MYYTTIYRSFVFCSYRVLMFILLLDSAMYVWWQVWHGISYTHWLFPHDDRFWAGEEIVGLFLSAENSDSFTMVYTLSLWTSFSWFLCLDFVVLNACLILLLEYSFRSHVDFKIFSVSVVGVCVNVWPETLQLQVQTEIAWLV